VHRGPLTEQAGRRAAVGLLCVLSTTVLCACGNNPAAKQRTSVAASGDPPQPPIPHEVRNAFAPFRSSPEPLPAAVARMLRGQPSAVNARAAQRLRAPDGVTVWAVASAHTICLVSQTAVDAPVSQTCTATSRALTNGVFFTTLSANGAAPATTRLVMGLVPDQVRRVRIRTAGAASAFASVTSNTFALSDHVNQPAERIAPAG
jgi:hypothetical protein